MPRKIPMRRCAATGESLPKKEMIRIVRTPEGTILVDPTGKANGRGAYIKKDPEAALLAKKNRSLEKALKEQIPEEFWPTLMNALK
jgi:predicted RNA-binding protein YlxR (DUF448 family)